MANQVQILDGFRYEFEEGVLWRADKGVGDPIVILKLIDDERGFEAHAYFPAAAFEKFKADAAGLAGTLERLLRVGV